MSLYGTLALLSWLGSFGFVVWMLVLEYKIIEAVNLHRSADQRLDLFSAKNRSFGVYRALYPSGKLVRKYYIANAGCIACFVIAIAFLAFAAR